MNKGTINTSNTQLDKNNRNVMRIMITYVGYAALFGEEKSSILLKFFHLN